jgi:[acyl-carrier-protein] S-malonyltransferase
MEKFAFVFPGQGTQFLQMGKSFYDQYEVARQTFQEASDVSGIDIAHLCFQGSVSSINEFSNMQLAILTTETAIYRAYMQDYGVAPQFAVGHSIGEYAALVSAGAVTFMDAVSIMMKRGELISRIVDKNSGHMTIVERTNLAVLEAGIKAAGAGDHVFVSCYNSNSQYALSGANDQLDKVEQWLLDQESSVSPLFSSPPMHSPLMNEICMEFLEFLGTFEFYPFRFPIISNYTGRPLSDPLKLPKYLTHHLISPVLFTSAMDYFHKYGVTAVIEMSPKLLLSEFLKENRPEIKTYCYGLIQDKQRLDQLFKSDPNFEKDMPDFLGRCLSILVSTENKNNNPEEFKEVVRIYEKLKDLYLELSQSKASITPEQQSTVLGMLITALKIKKLESRQIRNDLKHLLDETNTFYEHGNIYNAV